MKRLIVPALVVMAMTGCIIYEEDVIYEEQGELSDDRDPNDDDVNADPGDVGDDDPEPDDPDVKDDPEPIGPPAVLLYPSGGEVGSTIIVSVVVNVDADIDMDLTAIQDITFYGPSDIDIVTAQSRNADEHLLVLQINSAAATGDNDLLVEFEDGSAVFVHGAFEVLAEGSALPGDYYEGDACPE